MLSGVRPNASNHVRIARPSRDLARAERFWVEGLGLEVLHRKEAVSAGDDALLMLGWPQAGWHLELVGDTESETPPAPTEEDLLVLYLGGPIDGDVIDRLVAAGGERVASRNPYWDAWGVTFLDPDGYRLVLSHRQWP